MYGMPSAGGVLGPHIHARPPKLPTLLIRLGLSCTGTLGVPRSICRQQRRCLLLAASPSESSETPLVHLEDDYGDLGLGSSLEFNESELGPPPAVRYQHAMHIKDRKAWRSKAETMAKEKRLINIQIGQLGITPSFLRACADILQKYSLVRVKLGEGCGLERSSAAKLLEKYLDCVCVHQIGFTVTLYRQAGLPRPSNTLRSNEDGDTSAAAVALEAEAQARSAAAQEKQKRKKAGQQKPEQRPPEFSVL
ncbi:hypothetical protein VOLCADRAFT_88682 [Volvox carteri f. nagariensis]|uniref:CRM domain-containing protein n=1 Tax=Volvox carteri f. nagariensis TaxID=3068 RepID=D8TPN7_VOLCA|nr:uncharacterized protein VOLCADRAFT_88682 [Volvox carteri f. nagariensis]EFJ50647.1 hypothetical protein VOLCADRAFT_88682 [Volvox carteri f. nagariensis]|eukprot:XP_002948240.1 hypothetical protein VOLCADRAFT_88682 [Volvox carteri f. nagariensis]